MYNIIQLADVAQYCEEFRKAYPDTMELLMRTDLTGLAGMVPSKNHWWLHHVLIPYHRQETMMVHDSLFTARPEQYLLSSRKIWPTRT
jgi:hypothetical protein